MLDTNELKMCISTSAIHTYSQLPETFKQNLCRDNCYSQILTSKKGGITLSLSYSSQSILHSQVICTWFLLITFSLLQDCNELTSMKQSSRSTVVLLTCSQGWEGSNGLLYLRYRRSFQNKTKKRNSKSSQTTSLCYSIAKSTLSVPLTFIKFE